MTANHAHTPSLDQMRDLYVRHADQLGIASNHVLHAEFDRFIAAAEQRGAIKALRDAAEVMQDDLAWVNTQRGLLVFEHESDPGISPFQWLRSRADQLEGDDA